MKDRIITCENYICENADCKAGRKNVVMKKTCKNCGKYRPRKTGNVRTESVRERRDKILSHDMDHQIHGEY